MYVFFQSLGSNEIETGSSELSPFLQHLNTTILASNIIIDSKETNGIVQKSVVKDIKGIKVGIIGFLTPGSTSYKDVKINFIDEVIAVENEVAKLKAGGVKIIIALGHSDHKTVAKIASIEGIDLVINGKENQFTPNAGDSISEEVREHNSVKRVPIVQSHAYNERLGKIRAVFNTKGEITDFEGGWILLDEKVNKDIEMTDILERYKREVSASTPIGSTVVLLDGNRCRTEECNYGNLVADSIVYYYAIRHQGERWTDAPVAVISGSFFTDNIRPLVRPFTVSRQDLLSTIADKSNLVIVTMNGSVLKQVLEKSVEEYSSNNPKDSFLQFSGIRVVYDLKKEPGSRIISAVVRCWDCSIPDFFAINDTTSYKIIMQSTLASENSGYSMLKDLPRIELNYDAVTCTEEYIKMRSPVYPEVAERVVLLNTDAVAPDSASALSSSVIVFMVAILRFCIA